MIKPDSSQLLAIYLGLLLFGIAFNWFINIAERHGWLEGYVAITVAIGVLITLGAVALISPAFALITLGAFACSGTPMLIGSIYRHVRNRERFIRDLREIADE